MGACVSFLLGTAAEPRSGGRCIHPCSATPGFVFFETQAPDAGFEVLTLPSLIGQIWLWRSEAIIIPPSRTPHPARDPSPRRILCFPLRLTVKLKHKLILASKD